jgi:uncharacterized SAM-binding protein YcdF (DUF218 family)
MTTVVSPNCERRQHRILPSARATPTRYTCTSVVRPQNVAVERRVRGSLAMSPSPVRPGDSQMSRYTIWFAVEPSSLLAAGIVVGAFLAHYRIGRRLLWWSAMGLFVFGVLPLGGLLIAPLERRFAAPSTLEQVDGIIVLAGAERPDLSAAHGQPQFDRYTDRLTTFMMLAHRFPHARLVHSGGGDDISGNQSDVSRELLIGVGLDAERMVFERDSRNTCESAKRSFEQVRPTAAQRWLLVTSAAHVPRAVACFRAAGWELTPYPTDYKQAESAMSFWLFENLEKLDLAAHEWAGLAYYRVTGLTGELFPRPME